MAKEVAFQYKIFMGVKMPLIPVIFYNVKDNTKFKSVICLVDSGANMCLLDISIGRELNVMWTKEKELMGCACGREDLLSTVGEMLFEIDYPEFKGKLMKTEVLFPNPEASSFQQPKKQKIENEGDRSIMPLLGRTAFKNFEITFKQEKGIFSFKLIN